MATQVQFRRGTTTQNNAFTGAIAELTVDTEAKTIRLHDGSTAGGGAIVATLAGTQTFTNKTHSSNSVWQGTAVGLAYGGTNASLTAVAGGVIYSGASALAISAAGTSGQVLTSAGASAPTWTAQSSLVVGTATVATTATNIAGGSAGNLIIQLDTNQTTFVAAGAAGTFLKSTGASTAPEFAAGQITIGSTATSFGDTSTSLAGVRSITMGNGSHGGATVGTITGSGPWTATLTGISSTTGIMVGQNITATDGTGSLFGGSPNSVLVASIVSGTSITVTVTGGTTPTAGTITSLTTFGFLQVPTGTTAQRPWVPANGMIRYNSTQSTFEGYSSSAWSSLGGVKSVDGFTFIQAETSAGNSNGDLDFYAEDSAGTAATQVGQWNRTNLKDYTGTLVGTQTTQNVFNATATTVNAFGAATTLTIGATSGTTTVRNNLTVTGNLTVNGTTTTVNSTTVEIQNAFVFEGATADGFETTLSTVDPTADRTILLPDASDTLVGKATTDTLTNKTLTSPTLTTPVLGTPSSGTLTNCTGLPVSGITASTATAIGVGSIELGHATDTTIARSAAGVVTIEGVEVVTLSRTQTLTNKTLTSPTLTTPVLGTPSSGTLTSCTGLPVSTGISGLGTGVATALAVNTGSAGAVVLFNGALGTPSSGTLTNATGLPVSGINSSTSTALGLGSIELGHATDTTLSRSSAGVLAVEGVVVPTVSSTSTLTNKTLTFPIIDNIQLGYTTTATAAGTTTLTATSNRYQRFTGSTTQTIVLPVTSTLATGVSYEIENASTGNLTVNSSGGNLVITVIPGVSVQCMCIGTSLTTAADWDPEYNEFAAITGTGSVVLATSPQISSLGVGTAASGTTGEIRATNAITSFYSDERLKTDITEISGALDKVMQLRGVTFRANELAESFGYANSKEQVGVIAQDVEKVLPQIVVPAPFDIMQLQEGVEISRSGENYKTVHYEKLVPLLIQAIKEQQVMIEELQKKVG